MADRDQGSAAFLALLDLSATGACQMLRDTPFVKRSRSLLKNRLIAQPANDALSTSVGRATVSCASLVALAKFFNKLLGSGLDGESFYV
jgi:hypothetical protein